MSRLERWNLHLWALAMALSGLGYGWLKYWHQRVGEFGPEPYRAQAWCHHAHVFAAPFLLFGLGMIVKGHALPHFRAGTRAGRGSGVGAGLLLAPMILSGYGIQIVVDPAWRLGLAWIHGPFSLLFILAYAAHLCRPRRATA